MPVSEKAPRQEHERAGRTESLINRRRYLTTVGALATAPLFASVGGGVEHAGMSFSRRINIAKKGADRTGSDRIDSVVERYADDDTLLIFPGGRYKLGGIDVTNLSNFGLAAADGADVTLVPASADRYWLMFGGVDQFLFEGFDLDFTDADHGGRIQIIADGDFLLRDVTANGRYAGNGCCLRTDVRDPNGTALVERLIARGGGTVDGFGVLVEKYHAGEITFRDCELEDWPNNGLYASNPAYGEGGTVHVEGGLFKNNNVANIRVGSTGSTVRNATVVVDRDVQRRDVEGSDDRGGNARGIRLDEGGGVLVEGCDLHFSDGRSNGALVWTGTQGKSVIRDTRITVEGGQHHHIQMKSRERSTPTGSTFENVSLTGGDRSPNWANDPVFIGSGRTDPSFSGCCSTVETQYIKTSDACPMAGTNPAPHLDHEIVLSAEPQTDYAFSVSGDLRPGEYVDGHDIVSESSVEGYVGGGWTDDYRFSGEIADFSTPDAAALNVTIDGQQVDPRTLAAPPNELTISNRDFDEPATYAFTVSDDLEPTESVNFGDTDAISGNSANGRVNSGSDTYRFAGEVTEFARDGPIRVYLNGEEVDPDSLGRLPNELIVDHTRYDGSVPYEFTVSGEVRVSDNPQGDEAEGSTARGTVAGYKDGYRFSGEIASFTAEGLTDVYVNGTKTEFGRPGSLLTISRAQGSIGPVEYIVETTGSLLKSEEGDASINSNDEIRAGKTRGSVGGGTDAYWVLDGEVLDVTTFGGDVVTTLDGDRTDFGDG